MSGKGVVSGCVASKGESKCLPPWVGTRIHAGMDDLRARVVTPKSSSLNAIILRSNSMKDQTDGIFIQTQSPGRTCVLAGITFFSVRLGH